MKHIILLVLLCKVCSICSQHILAIQKMAPYFHRFPITESTDSMRKYILTTKDIVVDSTNEQNTIFMHFTNHSMLQPLFGKYEILNTKLLLNRSLFKDTIQHRTDTLDIAVIYYYFDKNVTMFKILRKLSKELRKTKLYESHIKPDFYLSSKFHYFKKGKNDLLNFIQLEHFQDPISKSRVVGFKIIRAKDYTIRITAVPSLRGNYFLKKKA